MSGNGMEHLRTPDEVAAFDLRQQQQAEIHELQQQNAELQAHVAVLTEGLNKVASGTLDDFPPFRHASSQALSGYAKKLKNQTPKQSLKNLQADGIDEMLSQLQDPNYPPMMLDRDSIEEYADQLREQAKGE